MLCFAGLAFVFVFPVGFGGDFWVVCFGGGLFGVFFGDAFVPVDVELEDVFVVLFFGAGLVTFFVEDVFDEDLLPDVFLLF